MHKADKKRHFILQVQTYIEDKYNKEVAVNDGGSITIITLSNVIRCSENIRSNVTSDGSNNIFVCIYSVFLLLYLNKFIATPLMEFWQ